MILRPLNKELMEEVRQWRLLVPETLRTPYDLTREQQEDYYIETICDRRGTTRYFAFYENEDSTLFLGMGGVESIQWENSTGEISVLINPACRGLGWGKKAVDAILDHGFNRLNLNSIFGECYLSSPAIDFWMKVIQDKKAFHATLPNRKYFNGRFWPSLYFMFERKSICEVTE